MSKISRLSHSFQPSTSFRWSLALFILLVGIILAACNLPVGNQALETQATASSHSRGCAAAQ
jgi:hypothetical protein